MRCEKSIWKFDAEGKRPIRAAQIQKKKEEV